MKYAEDNRVRIYEGNVARYIAEILLHSEDPSLSTASTWIEKAFQANTRNGMSCNLGWDYALYSQLSIKKRDFTNAKISIEKAIGIFDDCGADGWARMLRKKL